MSTTKVVMLSGGLDSVCLLWHLMATKSSSEKLRAVYINYGQKNEEQEHNSAGRACAQWGISLQTLDVPQLFQASKSTLLLGNTQQSIDVTSVEQLHRNAALVIVAAANTPYPQDSEVYCVAAHKTSAPYADATPRFYTRLSKLLHWSSNCRQTCEAPFIKCTKLQLAKKGWDAGMTKLDFLTTVSCYTGNDCGVCPACRSRKFVMERIFG